MNESLHRMSLYTFVLKRSLEDHRYALYTQSTPFSCFRI
jgi:hypothetical protein